MFITRSSAKYHLALTHLSKLISIYQELHELEAAKELKEVKDMTDRQEPPHNIQGSASGVVIPRPDINNNVGVRLGARPKVNLKSPLNM